MPPIFHWENSRPDNTCRVLIETQLWHWERKESQTVNTEGERGISGTHAERRTKAGKSREKMLLLRCELG